MRKTKKNDELEKREINDAMEAVEAYITGEYKSMYLMDAWMKIKEYLKNH